MFQRLLQTTLRLAARRLKRRAGLIPASELSEILVNRVLGTEY